MILISSKKKYLLILSKPLMFLTWSWLLKPYIFINIVLVKKDVWCTKQYQRSRLFRIGRNMMYCSKLEKGTWMNKIIYNLFGWYPFCLQIYALVFKFHKKQYIIITLISIFKIRFQKIMLSILQNWENSSSPIQNMRKKWTKWILLIITKEHPQN